MEWVVSLVEGADIEEVTDDMLEKMIVKEEKLSVLFYEENEEESNKVRYVIFHCQYICFNIQKNKTFKGFLKNT